jgi:geranylgeranyl transferase type-2 subunit beta
MDRCDFLASLDEALSRGLARLGSEFAGVHLRWVGGKQFADGGFPGRRSGSDPYYTDFAVRTISLLGGGRDKLSAAGRYLDGLRGAPRDVVECFNRLNINRILSRNAIETRIDRAAAFRALDDQRLPSGASARKGGTEASAYNTFLAALCFEMLGAEHSSFHKVAASLAELRRADGGYGDLPGEAFGQTSPTAAAACMLAINGASDAAREEGTVGFLVAMQRPDGGLAAHARAAESDLLSTFNGLVALRQLEALADLDLPAVGRFAKALASAGGGFRACPGDKEPDVEYTYYGVGAIAILSAHVVERATKEAT